MRSLHALLALIVLLWAMLGALFYFTTRLAIDRDAQRRAILGKYAERL